jgi:tetraacyldisaccharide 4'-kinase
MAPQRLRWPVISVGNLSVGGAGKTPLVICLAGLLEREGFRADVLSRGYGRSSRATERVDAEGNSDRFGDEPLLIARAAGVPVYVGGSRYEAGLLAEAETSAPGRPVHRSVHLLDDGFQHRQLARDVDVVVMHSTDLKERLLPAGRLREPLSSLRRADVIVLREEDAELAVALREYAAPQCRFWIVRRALALPIMGKRSLAFCAIARPSEFSRALAAAGVDVVEQVSFRDHHRYTARDMERLAKLAKRHGCDEIVTTAKDDVKLDVSLRRQLDAVAPLRLAELTLEIRNEAAALGDLVAMLGSKK